MFDRNAFLQTLAQQLSTIPIDQVDPDVLATLQGKSAVANTSHRNAQHRNSKRKNKNNTSLLDKNVNRTINNPAISAQAPQSPTAPQAQSLLTATLRT